MPAMLRPRAAPARLVFSVLLLALIVAGLLITRSGAQAANTQPSCGDTITSDTTLHADLVNCPNNGIVIGADNVTLDLNHHRIDGDGIPVADCNTLEERCDVGVDVVDQDGVSVVHGSVGEFEDGVIVVRARHTRLLGVSSSSNDLSGIVVSQSARALVRNSSGIGSTSDVGLGMFVVFSHRVRVLHSSFRKNGVPHTGRGLGVGIDLFESNHNVIKGNRLSRNRGAAITMDASDRNRVRHNRSVRDQEVGIWLVSGKHNVITRNRVFHLRQTGQAEDAAIQVDGGDRNVLGRNSIRYSDGDGIGLAGTAIANLVRGSDVRRAGGDGIHLVAKAATHTRLKRNRVRHSKDDGFDVERRDTKLTGNRAVRNGDLGIEARRGVIDGGGNRAHGNGDPRECTHIVCR